MQKMKGKGDVRTYVLKREIHKLEKISSNELGNAGIVSSQVDPLEQASMSLRVEIF